MFCLVRYFKVFRRAPCAGMFVLYCTWPRMVSINAKTPFSSETICKSTPRAPIRLLWPWPRTRGSPSSPLRANKGLCTTAVLVSQALPLAGKYSSCTQRLSSTMTAVRVAAETMDFRRGCGSGDGSLPPSMDSAIDLTSRHRSASEETEENKQSLKSGMFDSQVSLVNM